MQNLIKAIDEILHQKDLDILVKDIEIKQLKEQIEKINLPK